MNGQDVMGVWTPRLLSITANHDGSAVPGTWHAEILFIPTRATGAPELMSLLGLQSCLEIVGGLLIIAVLFTRPVAFILAGDMAAAYFMAHFPRKFFSCSERRRRGHPVLLHLPGGGRWRRLEGRCPQRRLTGGASLAN
jgi:uncharacterized membrane protein YphA (DoxX/SURF4 family)